MREGARNDTMVSVVGISGSALHFVRDLGICNVVYVM